jgi:small subunit ribosomal protein S1
MPNPETPRPEIPETPSSESTESFGELLSQYEKSHAAGTEGGRKQHQGTVVAVTSDSVLLDIGFKSEGILPQTAFSNSAAIPKVGDTLTVAVKGRNLEGYYELALGRVERPQDWPGLERAFAEKTTIVGTVTGVVKGGLTVDIGVRAFLPASRSGARDAAELEKLVGQEVRCRITKIDATEEDAVVDRRIVAEEEERSIKDRRYAEIREGDTLSGTVRTLTDYGAFIDLDGVDALLHVSDIAWHRIAKPADLLSQGQSVDVKVLKVASEGDKRRISVGMKQLLPHPWDAVPGKYKLGERVRGVITRVADFGAFVELEAGVEGLIHVSEMSWVKRVRKASDLVKTGDSVEAVILGINQDEHRMSLGLKQALGDPWADVPSKFPVGSVVEGTVTSLAKFGAFVQVAEGVEGMIHIGDITAEKRLNHPQEALRPGQAVKAQVLSLDAAKRLMKLGIRQMAPSDLDEYIAEQKVGDIVSGRLIEVSPGRALVELGEGVQGTCRLVAKAAPNKAEAPAKADLSSLSAMLQARWKSGSSQDAGKADELRTGQVRSFRITSLDPSGKKIELELE